MSRPVIGIIPLIDKERESFWMLPGYMNGIIDAGGIPVMLPLTKDIEIIKQLADKYDGFLFTGGQDVCPELYNEKILPECGECCSDRDIMEKELFSIVFSMDKPVFGICRGIQLINVLLGGTLYQDLKTQKPSNIEHHQCPPYDVPVHSVKLKKDMPLYLLIKKEIISVNSYHHQAIKNIAPKLSAMAYSEDGLIEAICAPEKKFVWATQWHPEFLFKKDNDNLKILKEFVKSCT